MWHIPGLHPVERQLPPRAILRRECRFAVHRVTNRALVPGGQCEGAVDRRDIVGIRAVLHLRLETFAFITELLQDWRGAVRKRKGSWQNLNHGPSSVDSNRLDLLL